MADKTDDSTEVSWEAADRQIRTWLQRQPNASDLDLAVVADDATNRWLKDRAKPPLFSAKDALRAARSKAERRRRSAAKQGRETILALTMGREGAPDVSASGPRRYSQREEEDLRAEVRSYAQCIFARRFKREWDENQSGLVKVDWRTRSEWLDVVNAPAWPRLCGTLPMLTEENEQELSVLRKQLIQSNFEQFDFDEGYRIHKALRDTLQAAVDYAERARPPTSTAKWGLGWFAPEHLKPLLGFAVMGPRSQEEERGSSDSLQTSALHQFVNRFDRLNFLDLPTHTCGREARFFDEDEFTAVWVLAGGWSNIKKWEDKKGKPGLTVAHVYGQILKPAVRDAIKKQGQLGVEANDRGPCSDQSCHWCEMKK